MIFIDTTTSARPLKAMPHASMDPMSVAMAQRPKLGVRLRQPEDGKPGVFIDEVLPGNTAEAAGLQAGDRLLKINEHAIDTVGAVRPAMMDLEAGDTVRITIEREGHTRVIETKLAKPDK
jgi:S1-C subfamily serine protease